MSDHDLLKCRFKIVGFERALEVVDDPDVIPRIGASTVAADLEPLLGPGEGTGHVIAMTTPHEEHQERFTYRGDPAASLLVEQALGGIVMDPGPDVPEPDPPTTKIGEELLRLLFPVRDRRRPIHSEPSSREKNRGGFPVGMPPPSRL